MNPITREEKLLDGQDIVPVTRKEKFIKRIYDKTQPVPDPITREEWFLKKAAEGSGGDVTIEQLNVSQNGTYSEEGKAYSPVVVNVLEPVLKTKTITANGTYSASADNADGYSQVTVAVDGFKKKSIANTPTDIASFNDGTANPMPKLEISIEPQQDLHGYDNPWVGGAGRNLFNMGSKVTATHAGLTITSDDDYLIINGTKYGGAYFTPDALSFTLPSGTYYAKAFSSGTVRGTVPSVYIMHGDTNIAEIFFTERTFTLSEETTLLIRFAFWTDKTVYTNYKIGVVISKIANIDKFYSYSNICPISGWSGANVTVADDLTTPTETHTLSIPFHDNSDNPVTVYGGTLNVTSGELRVTHANIASYNGETINEPWISSMDAYSAGATPTTGAQVVYPLATPQTYQLTPTQVSTLLGQNNIFADCGQVLEGEYFVTL